MAPSSPTTSRRWSLRSAREKDLSWSPHPQGSPTFCPHLKPQGQYPRAAGCPEAQQGWWHGGDLARCPLCPENTKLGVSSAGQCCYPKSLEQKHSWSETAPGPSWLQGASPHPHTSLCSKTREFGNSSWQDGALLPPASAFCYQATSDSAD